MKHMKISRYLAAPLAVAFALVLSGCVTVNTDYDHKVSFSNFHSYSWGSVKTSNPLYVQRVKDAVNPDLQAKGWQLVPSGGDVTVTAVGSSQDRQMYQTYYSGLGGEGYYYGGFGDLGTSTTTVENYKVGTLVVDMYDAKTKHLVWRSKANGNISNNPSNNTQRFDKAVDQMLANFPPK